MKNKIKKSIVRAFRLSLPVLAGYLFLGFAFGLLMRSKGFPVGLPIIMSIIIYSGALEFAAVPLLSTFYNPISSFILGLLLSARHLFYGIPMLKKYDRAGKMKPFLIFGLTDETFSVISSLDDSNEDDRQYLFFFITLFHYFYWIAGSALGAIGGNLIRFSLEGLDFALTALFVVLFIEQIKKKNGLISGLIGLIASALILTVFGNEYFVLGSMILIVFLLIAGKKVIYHE